MTLFGPPELPSAVATATTSAAPATTAEPMLPFGDLLPPTAPMAEEPVTRYETFTFTGDGREYFRIWIVNLMLSVVTFGIYSAWAKVRRQEYFYRHTRIAGSSFDYHGKPIAILKGRIVAAVLFGSYYLASYLSPTAGLVAFAVLAAVMPWILTRSLRFRLYSSSYRGLRFHFHGTTRQGYWVFLGLPLLSALTLFILMPLWHHRLKRFQHGGAAYGQTRFTFEAPAGAFYKAYVLTAVCLVGLVLIAIGLGMVLVVGLVGAGLVSGEGEPPPVVTTTMTVFFVAVYAIAASALWTITTVQIQNVVWRYTSIGQHRFNSTLEIHKLLAIVVTNLLGIVVTLGLFKPFAQIRLAKYVLGELTLVTSGNLDEFAGVAQPETSAFGEEAAELFDIDLGV